MSTEAIPTIERTALKKEGAVLHSSSILRKISFYSKWYREMPMGEKLGWKGKWVKDRCEMFQRLLMGEEVSVPKS